MTRQDAYQLLSTYLTNPNLIKHCIAAEAAMQALCSRLVPTADELEVEKWGITGLLHDADYELCKGHPEKHGLLLFEKEPNKVPYDIAYAIKSHNYEYTLVVPKSLMDWAITCCDQLTGLIVAAALVLPDKKLSSLTTESVLKRIKEKSFAKGANRKQILLCEEKLGIKLEEFVTIVLQAMQRVSNTLGL